MIRLQFYKGRIESAPDVALTQPFLWAESDESDVGSDDEVSSCGLLHGPIYDRHELHEGGHEDDAK